MRAIIDFVSHHRVGEPKAHLNLTVFPILNGGGTRPDYRTLDEALAGRAASITEVSSGGSVPELRFVNSGGRSYRAGSRNSRVRRVKVMDR
jgi:hypothetical protein